MNPLHQTPAASIIHSSESTFECNQSSKCLSDNNNALLISTYLIQILDPIHGDSIMPLTPTIKGIHLECRCCRGHPK